MIVAIKINTRKSLSLGFQPRSNKAEKFDYVSTFPIFWLHHEYESQRHIQS